MGLVLPVSLRSLRQRVRTGGSDRGAGGLLEAQPAATIESARIPSSPSLFIDALNLITPLDSLRAPV